MLSHLVKRKDIKKAQEELETFMRAEFPGSQQRDIAFPTGGRAGVEVWTLGNYWFRADNTFDRTNTVPRFMNWFGILGPGRLRISVEINVVPKGINRRVRGFFARDIDSGALCLMHTGDIAGGVPGIGGRAFRAVYGRRRLEVSEPEGRVRFGFVVICFGEEDQTYSAHQYVDAIVAFRQAVADGEIDIDDPQFQQLMEQFDDV